MRWIEAVYAKPDEVELSPGQEREKPHDWYAPYPEIPEVFLRPELIPLEMSDKDTPEKCDQFVRFIQRCT